MPVMSDLRIRKATIVDIPLIAALFQATLKKVNIRDYTPEQIEAWGKKANENRWRELFAGDLVFMMAEKNGELAGFTSVNANGYIHSMFVDYRQQRRGIATLLLHEAELFAKYKSAEKLTSEVSITARPFFEKHGFCVIRENVVNIGEVVMTNYSMEKLL